MPKTESKFIVVCKEGHKTYAPIVDELLKALRNVALDLENLKNEAQSASIRYTADISLKEVKAAIAKAEKRDKVAAQ